MKKINEMSEREILELILANQVTIAQFVFKIDAFLMKTHGKPYTDSIEHKDKIYDKLLRGQLSFIQQLNTMVDKEKR